MYIKSTIRYFSLSLITALCLVSSLSSTVNATTTLTFTNNDFPQDPFPATGSVGAFPFQVGREFRVVAAGDTVSGGGQKSVTTLAAGVAWVYSDDINLTSVLNSEMTPGTDGSNPAIPVSICAPTGDTGLFLNAPFLGSPFGFVAPIVGSSCGNLYGNGTVSVDVFGSTLQATMPVAEAQWAEGFFPLGLIDDGVNGTQIIFQGTMSNIQLDTPTAGIATFDFVFIANHIIQAAEDSLGFTGQTTQWELAGIGVAPFAAPNPLTSSSGTLTPTLGTTFLNEGHINKAELISIYGATDETGDPIEPGSEITITQVCVGLCTAYTVTAIGSPDVTVTIPLTAPIPQNAVYRKFINGAWKSFDESTGDLIESGPGVQGDCTGVAYTPGLTQGNFCIRLTISDGGPNDADGVVDDNVVDPGGLAGISGGIQTNILIPGQSLDAATGCSASALPVRLTERADWLILIGFVLLLGLVRIKRMHSS